MKTQYRIKEESGNGFEYEGKYFTLKQAQRIADKKAKAANFRDFGGKRQFWHGVVCLCEPWITMKDETYFRICIAGDKRI